jgi:hypothetical protein
MPYDFGDLATAAPKVSAKKYDFGDLATASPVSASAPSQDGLKAGDLSNIYKGPIGMAEEGAHLATGAIGGLAGGINYLGTLAATRDPDAAKAVQEETQNKLTYQPRTLMGQKVQGVVDYIPSKIASKANQAGEYVSDKTGSPALGAAVNTGLQAAPMLVTKGLKSPVAGMVGRSERAAATANAEMAPEAAIAKSAQDKGFALPPSEINPSSPLNQFFDSVVGPAKTNQALSVKNARVTNSIVKKDFGIPEGESLDGSTLAARRAEWGNAYEAIKPVVPVLKKTHEFNKAVSDLYGNRYAESDTTFGKKKVSSIEALQQRMKRSPDDLPVQAVMQEVQKLRAEAKLHKGPNQTVESAAIGDANINAADALENLMLENLKAAGQPELYQQMLEARKKTAQSYVVENALNGRGGVSAKALAAAAKSAAKKGVTFTDSLADVSSAADAYPKAFQDLSGPSPSGSPLQYLAAGDALVHGHPVVAGLIAAKNLPRNVITTDAYQRRFVNPQPVGVNSMLRGAHTATQLPPWLIAPKPQGSQ